VPRRAAAYERATIADLVADHAFKVTEMAEAVIKAADGDVVPFRGVQIS
jgi:hypothetical protein